LKDDDHAPARAALTALNDLEAATDWLVQHGAADIQNAAAAASPYLRLFGTVAGGWLMARADAAARRALQGKEAGHNSTFLNAKIASAQFYAENILPRASSDFAAATRGTQSTLAYEESWY